VKLHTVFEISKIIENIFKSIGVFGKGKTVAVRNTGLKKVTE